MWTLASLRALHAGALEMRSSSFGLASGVLLIGLLETGCGGKLHGGASTSDASAALDAVSADDASGARDASGPPDASSPPDASGTPDASMMPPCNAQPDEQCCGIVCPCELECSYGQCQLPTGLVTCQGQCVSLGSNDNCGGCGVVCQSGELCVNGACEDVVSCSGGEIDCDNTCVDPSTDDFNCGGCDQFCPAFAQCEGGACQCPAGQGNCGGDVCAELQGDGNNCGSCGATCTSGTVCNGGKCEGSCSAGLTACGSSCVDLQSDLLNCGACGGTCTLGLQTCQNGSCICIGADGGADGMLVLCDSCVDLQTDDQNCGACGHPCASGMTCRSGSCQ